MNFRQFRRALFHGLQGKTAGQMTYDIFDYLSKVALVSGIIFSIYQYSVYKHDDRVRYTFQFLERFDSDRMLTARSAVEAAVRSQEVAIEDVNRARVSKKAEAALRKRISAFLVVDSNGGKGVARELELIIDYFDGVRICLDERLCDATTARAFLASHAGMIWTNFSPYIRERRTLTPSFGRGLETLVMAHRTG
jgi:hypothetical protein